MATITRGWPPARRQAQAQRIRAFKPWLHSTGPRSDAGKRAVCRNAVKHHMRSAAMERLRHALKLQRAFMKQLNHHGQYKTAPLSPAKSRGPYNRNIADPATPRGNLPLGMTDRIGC